MGITHPKDLMLSSGVLGLQDAHVHMNSSILTCVHVHTHSLGHFGESANTSGSGNGLLVAVSSHGYSMSISVKHPNLIHEDSPPRSYLSSHLYLPQQRLGFSVGTWGRHSSQQLCRKPDGSFFFSYKL